MKMRHRIVDVCLRKYRIIGWWYGEVNFSQAWPANFAGLLAASQGEFAGCGWLKVIRQAATHIVRYFLKENQKTQNTPETLLRRILFVIF